MDRIRIKGGKSLNGSVEIGGAKNAALPILFSTLLCDEPVVIDRVPGLQDIKTTISLLEQLGCTVERPKDQSLKITAKNISSHEAPYDLVRKMRASVVVLGPLLARLGKAKVSLPGGCAIGARPINFHLAGLEKLGASIRLESGYVIAEAKKLRGNRVPLEFPSVGATENIMMAAVLAEGETLIENAAKEPEISDLALMLSALGARIEGAGTAKIRIQGVSKLSGGRHEVMGDRIEAGTFLAAAFATQGEVTVRGIDPQYLESILVKLEEAGATVSRGEKRVSLKANGRPRSVDVTTLPYPGFPTDMQAQMMALMSVADGTSVISETIFENRFMHVPELARLGAAIAVRGNTAIVKGKPALIGAPLMATDLRASACLIVGGLCAEGETVVNRIYHLDRGYENLESKFRALGADIERERESE